MVTTTTTVAATAAAAATLTMKKNWRRIMSFISNSNFSPFFLFHNHLIWVCYLKKNRCMHYEKFNAVAVAIAVAAGRSLSPSMFVFPTLRTCLTISWARIKSNGKKLHFHRKMYTNTFYCGKETPITTRKNNKHAHEKKIN